MAQAAWAGASEEAATAAMLSLAAGEMDESGFVSFLRENVAAVVAAVDAGVPVTGYWHWSLVDNYEWGSYEPRFGLHGVDRSRGPRGGTWLETDAMGRDAAGAYRRLIAGLRSGDRSVLEAG